MISEILLNVFTIPIVIGVFGAIYFLNTNSRKKKLLLKIPGSPQVPFFGNAFEFSGPPENVLPVLINWCKKYGPRCVYRIGYYWGVLIASAKDMEKVLSSSTEIVKNVDYSRLEPWLGNGLLISKGKKWFHRRKLITPTFHFKILEEFLDVFNEQSAVMVEILNSKFSKDQIFDLSPYIARCALDIICETAMGQKINAQNQTDSEYIKAIYRMSELQQYRGIRPWFHVDFVWHMSPSGREEKRLLKILHELTERVIRERKFDLQMKQSTTTEKTGNIPEDDVFMKAKRRLAFLDLLIEAQQKPDSDLTDSDIREETDTFMFEGHDTTSASANFTIFLLGCHPEIQAKVHEELDSVFGSDRKRPITMQDLTQMKYLECCIKESLRLYPSVPFIGREFQADFQLDEDTLIPSGTTAFIFIHQLHRDPKYFPDPEKFQPDRFFPENSIGRHPYSYVPFSAGPRNCIGQKFAMMEEKVMIATMFRNFTVKSVEKHGELVILAELISRSKSGIKVKIVPRS